MVCQLEATSGVAQLTSRTYHMQRDQHMRRSQPGASTRKHMRAGKRSHEPAVVWNVLEDDG